MRPVTITGVTGTSDWVPVDAYSRNRALVSKPSGGTPTVQYTFDDVFDSTVTPVVSTLNFSPGFGLVPAGARAVRGASMVPADKIVVSQQGIA